MEQGKQNSGESVLKVIFGIILFISVFYIPVMVRHHIVITKNMREVSESIQYKADIEGGYWQAPSSTERLGTGDCEDYAFLLWSKFAEHGLKLEMHKIKRKSDGGLHWVLMSKTKVYEATNGMIYDREEYMKNWRDITVFSPKKVENVITLLERRGS